MKTLQLCPSFLYKRNPIFTDLCNLFRATYSLWI